MTPILRALFAALTTLAAPQAAFAAQAPPASMKGLVLHASHRDVLEVELGGSRFHYVAPFSKLPFLIWPDAARGVRPFEHDREAVRGWIARHAGALGSTGLRPVFDKTARWRRNMVWVYRFEREGVRLHGARVEVHWHEGELQGLLNVLPGPIKSFDAATSVEGTEDVSRVWYPMRRGAGGRDGVDLVRARVVTKTDATHVRTSYHTPSGELIKTVVATAPGAVQPPAPAYQWKEYTTGSFPDQIDSDSAGDIWFSQPLNDQIQVFDPVSETFQIIATGNDDPDGLAVDSKDRVWSGLYVYGRGMGRIDVATHNYTVFPPPYPGAYMAIPFETCGGSIWVSDHQVNRVSEFDPVSETWLGDYEMPTPACWIVDTTEDPLTQTLFFTEYDVNQLGMKTPGGPIVDIPVSWGGPSFHVFSGGKVYYTLWIGDALGAYDVDSGTYTEYQHPVSGETGGPIGRLSNGDVAVGSRNAGYVFIFHVATETWHSYKIPTSNPGLKDGLHVDANDVVWVTESGVGQLGKLDLQSDAPAPLTLAVSGSCPGTVTGTVGGATPGGQVGFLFARITGSANVPCGMQCGGRQLGLGPRVRLVAIGTADANGDVIATGIAPVLACGGYLQAIDLSSCRQGEVKQIPQ
ncbi:MAG: hypothetical protein CME06_10430 [Gemmatimonadetes bacterium]|nr:hypothetical protein [Gemmatimonadota bacterium]